MDTYPEIRHSQVYVKSKRKERVLTSSNILDAWPTFNAEDSIYYLVYKTPKKLDSTKIEWWKLSGDSLKIDFTKRMKSMTREQLRRDKVMSKRSQRSERSISKRRSRKTTKNLMYWNSPLGRKGLPRYDLFYQEFNKHRGDNDLSTISKEKWESIYASFTRNPWPYYANSQFQTEQATGALKLKGFKELDETSWYKQYSAIELFNTAITDTMYKTHLTKILVMDFEKKTYMTTNVKYSYYSSNNKIADFHFILPKAYNPNIRIAALGSSIGFYSTKPHFNYKNYGNKKFDFEEIPLNLINFETFFEIIEDKD